MHKSPRRLVKPSADFPLTPHATGYWVKMIRGKVHYFGDRWADPYEALKEYHFKREYLEQGLPVPSLIKKTLADALDDFLIAKHKLVKKGEMTVRTWNDYNEQCKKILAVINGERSVTNLTPHDFQRLRDSFKGGPVTIANNVVRSRVAFTWIEKHVEGVKFNYLDCFERPSKRTMRKHKSDNPKRVFTAEEIRLLVEHAKPQMKAMILLGINCGMGNTDVGLLEADQLDLDNQWHAHARPKTGVARQAYLWDETVAALRVVLGNRRHGLVFKTKYGNPWAKDDKNSPLSHEFAKLRDNLGLEKGLTFYRLRHTFQTIGDNSLDFPVVQFIMGHADATMSGVYRGFPEERLRRVADIVHDWLFPPS